MFEKILRRLVKSPGVIRLGLNFYAPLRGAGIRVHHISPAFDEVEVHMPLRRKNKNIMGTHFGGSLYAMADPFYMLMLMVRLGDNYRVWDQAASIKFVAPGVSTVKGVYRISEEELAEIKLLASGGQKVLYTFEADIVDAKGAVVAHVTKVLYIRLKKQHILPTLTGKKNAET